MTSTTTNDSAVTHGRDSAADTASGDAPLLITDVKAFPASNNQGARVAAVEALSLDPDGNCRVNILTSVPDGPKYIQHPWSRCYIVESKFADGSTLRTSGYALSATRVITTDAHFTARSINVSRAYVLSPNPGGPQTTAFDSQSANAVRAFTDADRQKIGYRYCILGMANPLSIRDSAGDNTYGTITSLLSINPTPPLTLLTRRVPSSELLEGTSVETPRRITNDNLSEWYVTHLGGYIGRGADDYMRGSPILVKQETFSGGGFGNETTDYILVGLVTDEVVASDPCTVNAGLFVDTGAVTQVLGFF